MNFNSIRKTYSVRFTPEEKAAIIALAAKHNVTVSEWIRNASLNWRSGKVKKASVSLK